MAPRKDRCLRQGDPLSPMLFVIVVGALSILMERAHHMKPVSGSFVGNEAHEVTHLQFTDDTIIF